ncbi:GTP-binding protein (HSR1-related) [Prochlorococcus marinus str. MIT 9515]|uniref:GTPase Der n=1 Tax=Prochlorococcus marinus (strain MIT 9515) TaxID=167542 RepID=DER_PROM5|nr:ribosome biogenesis GTPase Der [Prochlorococcus marinus]A2BV51.1 RecName: Full=GTPase Der; AltName: Full=GTP-binding protein EngA [Prochlorococcus marinus str. MIT 9515]ABM71662.1 GTP-binding protein (HSR1-related) [Prochlorococcus marinus str. MIT 9515]
MTLPSIAIIGRPNVGKSTLVNRLCQSNDAIVFDKPGVTRDRTYQNASWGGKEFQVVDTGGLVFEDDSEFLPEIRTQVFLALEEASIALFVVDGNQGVTTGDLSIAKWLRNSDCKTIVAVNKCESLSLGISMASEFWKLGLGEPYPVSAIHGSGTGDLLDLVIDELPKDFDVEDKEDKVMMSIIGRPNVGKSSLLNAICGEKRAIVSDISGTTTDSIDTLIKKNSHLWKIVDTAGIRRKKNVKYGTEFFGINRAFKSIDRSDVCVLVIDAIDGVTDQDQKLAGRIEEQGRACVIVVNKWDLVEKNNSTIYQVEKELRSKLYFLHWSKMIFISALTGQRVENIFEHALNAVTQHRMRVTTSVVNEVLKEALGWKSPPTKRSGKQGRLYYGTQVKNQPPTFTLFVNDPKLFGITYRRYIEKQIRLNLGFEGSPIILLWRGKQKRDLEKETSKKNINIIQKD